MLKGVSFNEYSAYRGLRREENCLGKSRGLCEMPQVNGVF